MAQGRLLCRKIRTRNPGQKCHIDPSYKWSSLATSADDTLPVDIPSSGFLAAQNTEFDKSDLRFHHAGIFSELRTRQDVAQRRFLCGAFRARMLRQKYSPSHRRNSALWHRLAWAPLFLKAVILTNVLILVRADIYPTFPRGMM